MDSEEKPPVLLDPSLFMLLEKNSADRTKADPTGAGRISPNRLFGESEIRHPIQGQLDIARQVEQILYPRDYPSDTDSTILSSDTGLDSAYDKFADDISSSWNRVVRSFADEPYASAKDLTSTQQPLKDTEYKNRKQLLHEKKVQTLMAEGLTKEEAERKIEYNLKEGRKLRTAPISTEDYIAQLERDKPEYWKAEVAALRAEMERYKLPEPEVFSFAVVDRKLDNNEKLTPAETAFWIETIVNKRHEMFPTNPDDKNDNKLNLLQSKVAQLELQIEILLVDKPAGWAADVVDKRRLQAEQMQLIQGDTVEPPPPPPVVDFSTHDLEQPERFIIKDLELFKFDPDTKFDGLRLPYESCLFVLGTDLRAVVLATQEEENVITLKLLSETDDKTMPWHAEASLYVRLRGTKAELRWIKTKRSLDKRLGMVTSVLAFLAGEQLEELQIETVITAPDGRDIPPPKPGWCYNVVHLAQGRKGKRKDWQGGTHASPREHKRRGYWWPGKNGPIWIKPTIVNKGVLGRVDKEYHVTKLIETSNG